MPRYFFDTNDGETRVEDPEGLELDGSTAVRIQVRASLADMARDELPLNGERRTMMVWVRDETGKTVLRAALSLLIEDGPEA